MMPTWPAVTFSDQGELETMASRSRGAVMKRSRFTDEQIVRILQDADKDLVAEVAKHHGGGQAFPINVGNPKVAVGPKALV